MCMCVCGVGEREREREGGDGGWFRGEGGGRFFNRCNTPASEILISGMTCIGLGLYIFRRDE